MNTIPFTLLLVLFGIFSKVLCKDREFQLQRTYNEEDQANAALDIIRRVLPDEAHYFHVTVNFSLPRNHYQIAADVPNTGLINITASSGVAAAKGFYDYLRDVHQAQVAWEGSQVKIHDINKQYFKNVTSKSKYIYFQNVCTFSYTYAFWTFENWRKHIDWIALHGINLVLAPFQEDVWADLYKSIGMTDIEIQEQFAGPAFFAWGRMGNVRGWGGPLPFTFIDYSSQLQQKVITEYQKLGINFALPSFAGHVPVTFKKLFPNTKFQSTSRWLNFPRKFCCPLYLDPTDPLFHEIGTQFLRKAIEKYGTSHIYFADPFNELTPPSSDTEYLKNVSQAIYNVMQEVDSKAIWLLQGWMFYNEAQFWKEAQIKAFLTAIEPGQMLVLDLHSDQFPQYNRTMSYFGQPFIWCMLHNFGGNSGLHGSASLIAERIYNVSNDDNYTMVGVGITPEGIDQNHVMYEFTLDLGWIGDKWIDSKSWFSQYGYSRYGMNTKRVSSIYETLYSTVYNYNGTKRIDGVSHSLVVDTPSLNLKPWSWFDPVVMKNVLNDLLSLSQDIQGELYKYDVVDFTRQFLQNMIDLQYIAIMDSYQNDKNESVVEHINVFLDLVSDVEHILRTNKNFLIGNWLEAAKIHGKNLEEKELFEYNARNQITIWGPNGEIKNYAIKQWSGLIEDFVLPRWKIFMTELKSAVEDGHKFNEKAVVKQIFNNVELPFSDIKNVTYPTVGTNDEVEVATSIFNKYKNLYVDPKWLDILLNVNSKIVLPKYHSAVHVI